MPRCQESRWLGGSINETQQLLLQVAVLPPLVALLQGGSVTHNGPPLRARCAAELCIATAANFTFGLGPDRENRCTLRHVPPLTAQHLHPSYPRPHRRPLSPHPFPSPPHPPFTRLRLGYPPPPRRTMLGIQGGQTSTARISKGKVGFVGGMFGSGGEE